MWLAHFKQLSSISVYLNRDALHVLTRLSSCLHRASVIIKHFIIQPMPNI